MSTHCVRVIEAKVTSILPAFVKDSSIFEQLAIEDVFWSVVKLLATCELRCSRWCGQMQGPAPPTWAYLGNKQITSLVTKRVQLRSNCP
jgi:hypothetical protein